MELTVDCEQFMSVFLGTSTFIMLAPQQKAGVVVLINMDGVDSSALATDLMKILLGTGNK